MFAPGVERRQLPGSDFPRRQIELHFAIAQSDDARKACGDIDLVQCRDEGGPAILRGLCQGLDGS